MYKVMKAKVAIGIVAILLGCSFPAVAQMTAYANIYAEVVAPVGIEKTNDLTFSDIIATKKSSKVVLGAENFRTVSDGELSQNGRGTLATFSVAGGSQTTFDITLPKETFAIGNGSDNNMVVNNFTATSSPTNALQSSASIIKIGATLHVPENQAVGNYNAQNPFLVTLNYN
jgi:hypothetical protein